ncbi:hypothetical protein ACIOZM_20560 [Pseudomonas sp. NPDC087346]|uniref:hypothetical protein n=1 Tax=Pseudomonas sp. NPDC087346 TaxID=3364438 RepID=UPI0038093265
MLWSLGFMLGFGTRPHLMYRPETNARASLLLGAFALGYVVFLLQMADSPTTK